MKIYTELIKGNEVLERKEIGTAKLDEGRLSARKYNELKRALMKECTKKPKNCTWKMVTENGLKDTFGGYPANTFVRFN
jgi:hypothetical protein